MYESLGKLNKPHKPTIENKPWRMTSEFPSKDQLRQQAIDGRPITQSEASAIATAEADRSDAGLVKGGSAATAQSLHDKQQNFLEKAGGAARKYPGEVTKEDAAEVQRAEVRFLF
ncbi:hypothetical protein SCUP515_07867 [Seiridium cupressi]